MKALSTNFLSLILITLLSLGSIELAHAQSAKQIVQAAIDKANGASSMGEMEMTIVRKKYERSIRMKNWSFGQDHFMVYVTAPARDEGQVFLKRDVDMWNWIPSIGRKIKIPPSMMGQSWMGSDFTNDDLVKMNSMIDDYEQNLLGSETVAEQDCHKIELIPNEDAAVVWGKIVIWIEKQEYYQMKTEFYDEDMELVSRMEAFDIKQFDDRKLPSRMVMTPMDKPDQQTILKTLNLKFNTGLTEDFFSQQNMEKVR